MLLNYKIIPSFFNSDWFYALIKQNKFKKQKQYKNHIFIVAVNITGCC